MEYSELFFGQVERKSLPLWGNHLQRYEGGGLRRVVGQAPRMGLLEVPTQVREAIRAAKPGQ
eukprot:4452001-Heterocapsa_arctica.AAC.1